MMGRRVLCLKQVRDVIQGSSSKNCLCFQPFPLVQPPFVDMTTRLETMQNGVNGVAGHARRRAQWKGDDNGYWAIRAAND